VHARRGVLDRAAHALIAPVDARIIQSSRDNRRDVDQPHRQVDVALLSS